LTNAGLASTNSLTRRTRALARRSQTVESGMYLFGSVYNFCTFHNSLSVQVVVGDLTKRWVKQTPAMAYGRPL
jgi:hypothetical protein